MGPDAAVAPPSGASWWPEDVLFVLAVEPLPGYVVEACVMLRSEPAGGRGPQAKVAGRRRRRYARR